MSARSPDGDLVVVEWGDAHSDSKWQQIEEALETHGAAHCFSVGWVLKRNKSGISLYASIVDGEQVGEVSFIPAGMVKRVKVLKKARKS